MSWAGTAPTGSYCPLAFAVSAPHGRALRQPLTCAGEKKACPRPAHDSSQSRIDMDAKRLVAHGRDRQHTCASCSVAAAHAAARHVARTGWTGCQGHRPCRRCHGCRRQHRQRARGPGRRHGLVGWGTLAAAAPSLPCCRPRLRPRRLRARPPPPPPPPASLRANRHRCSAPAPLLRCCACHCARRCCTCLLCVCCCDRCL